jgi:hypothetical protein
MVTQIVAGEGMKPKSRQEVEAKQVRISTLLVMDQAVLERARKKAEEHDMPFPDFLERACRLYGKYLDKKVTVIARPI